MSRSRRSSAAALVAVAALVTALGIDAWRFWPALRGFDGAAASNAAMTPLDRRLRAARAVDVSTDMLMMADAFLPPNATFIAQTGSNIGVSTPVTLDAFPLLAQWFLLPRRGFSKHPHWLLCYGCDRSRWEGKLRTVWSEGTLSIARIRR